MRHGALLLACLAALLACSATPAFADPESCERGAPPGYNVITGRSGAIEGTPANDYIVGSSGPDTITAGYGNDIVCAGDGDDVVYGGGKGDDLHGQNGRDKLFGQLLDDELYGGPERDVLIGGHGTDEMDGGEGNDWLRGGTNVDHYRGGRNSEPADNDNDVASFADATPTGGHVAGWNGVVVNLTESVQETVPPHSAKGGGEDTVEDIESVIGSPFDDNVIGNTAEPNRSLYGGMGTDSCSGGCREPSTNLTAPFAYLDKTNPIAIEPTLPDPMLIVVGGSAAETIALSNSGGTSFTVTASAGGSPETLNSDPSCSRPTRGTVTCLLGSAPLAGGQTWFGGAGNDTMTDRTAAPNGMTTDLDGGDENDTITGSPGSETLVSGQSGNDVMHGGAEGDALLALGTGGDQLFGEEGNDQLATGEPCAGHVYRGGPDQDVAGFARTTESGVTASLGDPDGDPATLGSSWYGAAYRHNATGGNACAGGARTWVGADNEILEGTNQDDFLTGNQNDNTIWAREGVDRVHAGVGDDIVEGNNGADTVFGEAGRDVITGGPGPDRLHGEEGEDDIEGQDEPDELWGEDGNDRLFGGENGDELFGGAANDLIDGGNGVDELFGQAGNDRLRARDGTTDGNVNCGADADEAVEADPFDPVVNCER
jgi:Ca2+-binding RTX toxin-like protein